MLHPRILIYVLSLVLLPYLADAQVRVTKSAGEKSTINLTGLQASGGAAATFRRTLENDLVRSGWFVLSSSAKSEFVVTGDCAERGGNLEVTCRAYGSVTQKTYLNSNYKAPRDGVRRLAHRIADEIVGAVVGRKGMASARIAMIGNQSGHKEVYLCDADGGSLIKLTSDRNVSISPNWSPDGRKLVYTSYLKNFPDVFMIDIETGTRRSLSEFSGLNTGAAISPDGRDVALILSKDGNPELYVMSISGRRVTRLTTTLRAAEASPTWSPDGRQIAFVSDQSGSPQVYIVSAGGGRAKRLTSRGRENVAPDWGSNGLIAYCTRVGGHYEVAVIDPQTLQVKQISRGGADYEDPSWAPDGRHIFCSRTAGYRSKVYLLDTIADEPVALTDYPGDWFSPACTPN